MAFPAASLNAPPSTLVFVKKRIPAKLNFHERQVSLPKERGLQQALAEHAGMHISQIRRYESAADEDLKLQFEAVSRLNKEEKNLIRSVMESTILRNTMKEAARHFTASGTGGSR